VFPEHLGGEVTVELSENSPLVVSESNVFFNSKDVTSLVVGSDGLSSSVEGEPLLLVIWVVILDFKIVLTSTVVVGLVDSSVFSHSGSDLESNSRGKWLLGVGDSLSVSVPSLVGAIVALEPVNMSSMGVGVTMNIEASDSNISDVSLVSREPSDLLEVVLSGMWSHNSSVVMVEPVVSVLLD